MTEEKETEKEDPVKNGILQRCLGGKWSKNLAKAMLGPKSGPKQIEKIQKKVCRGLIS